MVSTRRFSRKKSLEEDCSKVYVPWQLFQLHLSRQHIDLWIFQSINRSNVERYINEDRPTLRKKAHHSCSFVSAWARERVSGSSEVWMASPLCARQREHEVWMARARTKPDMDIHCMYRYDLSSDGIYSIRHPCLENEYMFLGAFILGFHSWTLRCGRMQQFSAGELVQRMVKYVNSDIFPTMVTSWYLTV
jgi:hypothetical protein